MPSHSRDLLRIWRFPYSFFGGSPSVSCDGGLSDETVTADKAYTDAALKDIAASGFNAIWVHGLLHNLVSVPPFPELGSQSSAHVDAMRRLIGRAATHGLKVFIYMQPPRALPVAWADFWSKHPGVWGQETAIPAREGTEIRLRSLCTSVPEVKAWLAAAAARLGSELAGLGGIILITASEYPAHCCRNMPTDCPRCAQRTPEEVAAEIVSLMERGIHSTAPDARVIAWNWSWWWHPDSQEQVVRRFPKGVILMADFERGGIKDLPGKKGHLIDEYSLSYGGPSERFLNAFALADKQGLPMMAKLQLGTTHELGSVVSLPLLGNIYDKADFIRSHNLIGFMGCWNFGNFTSANTAGFNYFLGDRRPADKPAALREFAAAYFPGCDAAQVVTAWSQFESAMDYFPFWIPFLYYGVQNFALSLQSMYDPGPLAGRPAGGSWLNVRDRGDDLSAGITKVFPLDDIIYRLGEVAKGWRSGCEIFARALAGATGPEAELELGNALIAGAAWRSAQRAYRLYALRKSWHAGLRAEYMAMASDELADLAAVLPHVERDPRQGYHAEAGCRMFDGPSLRAKMLVLERQMERAL